MDDFSPQDVARVLRFAVFAIAVLVGLWSRFRKPKTPAAPPRRPAGPGRVMPAPPLAPPDPTRFSGAKPIEPR